jgi:thiaminase/transcriptional activator TenA
MSKWSENVWREIAPIFEAIKVHPFLTELAEGALDKEKFLFFLRQDALYLADFSRALAGIAVKCEKSEHAAAFLSFAGDAVAVELSLHASYLGELKDLNKNEQSPACLLYTSYILRQLSRSPLEAAAATVLPCFWIYKAVGEHLLALGKKADNPYQAWIDAYGSPEFGLAADRAINIADELAALTTTATREEMTRTFVICSEMEWMFWDSAYKLEKWPLR